MTWFDEARFGMFVHWGPASLAGREMSWPMIDNATGLLPHAHEVAVEDYYDGALDFAPDPDSPRRWCALARASGMRYVVLTTRHHDGFALFETDHTDFGIAQSAGGADLVRSFADAARAEGLRVGFYLSLSDWHHPDYPAFREQDKPYLGWLARGIEDRARWDRYLDSLFGQVRQLLTDYGPVDVLWFDGQWERSAHDWRAAELRSLIRELQPDCLVNDRLPGQGDFDTPEQSIPPSAPTGRWETCMTMNHTWGWHPEDEDYKSVRRLVHSLCETAGRGGNLLLNVSPMGDGRLPDAQVERLDAVGRWMADHGTAIHGTEPGLEPWQFYGPSTRQGDRIFLHLLMQPYETVSVRGIAVDRVRSVRHVPSGTDLDTETSVDAATLLSGGEPIGELIIGVPPDLVDPVATTIELQLDETRT